MKKLNNTLEELRAETDKYFYTYLARKSQVS